MLLNYVIIIIATAPKISYFSPAESSYRSNIHMYNRKNMQLIFFKSDSVKNNQRCINTLTYNPSNAPVITISYINFWTYTVIIFLKSQYPPIFNDNSLLVKQNLFVLASYVRMR